MELFCNLLYGAIRMRDEDQWIETVFSIKLFYIDFFGHGTSDTAQLQYFYCVHSQ